DLVPDAAVALGDRACVHAAKLAELLLELGDPRLQARQRVLEREHVLDARMVEPERRGERLDALQPCEVGVGVEPPAPGRSARHDQAPGLVEAQRLGVHADELGCHGDGVLRRLVDHVASAARANRSARGSSPSRAANFSSASFWARLSLCGTEMCTRASRSPRLPESPFLGAPRPRARSRTPSAVPALSLSRTRSPSGAGTSIVAPAAASLKSTGTSTTRSSPRRVKIGEGSTVTCTKRSPAGAPCVPASPLPRRRMRAPSLMPAGI